MNGSALRVWLIDDDASIRWVLERALRNDGMAPRAFEAAEPALDALRRESPDVLITDIRMPGASGLELLKRIHDARPQLPVIVMTAHSDLANAVSAYEGGAFEYLPKPFDIDQAIALVRRAASAGQQPGTDPGGAPRMPELLGTAPAMQQVFRAIGRLSRSSVTVLITGESGTGKELVARALHEHSPRAERPFIALNTAAIPADLLESELFGHERGAFTGADAQRRGRFEQADGGTLFLDEIGDMPLETQAKILRVLQERELERVGGNRTLKVDVRILATTNQDLEAKVQAGSFREDLYYRLNVVSIVLPALRERTEDLPLLIEHALAAAAARLKREPKPLAADAYRALCAHEWKGNVRELEHAIEQAVALASGPEIALGDLPASVRDLSSDGAADPPGSFREAKQQAVERFERQFIHEALARHHGNISKAAEDMGMYRQHLQLKLAEYGIDAAAYRER